MKKLLFLLPVLFFFQYSNAQSSAEDYIEKGMDQHDMGSYENAIESYKKALELKPEMSLIHYEMALTYMYMQKYEKTIFHCNEVLKEKNQYHLQAYIAKGSAEDNLGEIPQAIKTYKKGIKQFGTNSLLHYNLALTYYRAKLADKAQEELIEAIKLNPNHSSSHLLLSNIVAADSKKMKTILSSAYFLLLEPTSSRSKSAYNELFIQLYGNVSKDKNKPNTINITVNPDARDDEFGTTETFLPLLIASHMGDNNSDKSKEELLAKNLETIIGILKEETKTKSFFQEFYVSFFKELKEKNLVETFCAHITQGNNPASKSWLDSNKASYSKLLEWLKSKDIQPK